MSLGHALDDDEGMDLSTNINWTSALGCLKSILTGSSPWGYLVIAFVLTDGWYSRRQGR